MSTRHILFILPYPIEGPSNRFRVHQYLPYLKEKNISYSIRPFYRFGSYGTMHKKGHFIKKAFFLVILFICRAADILTARFYDITFIHREASPSPDFVYEKLFQIFSRKLVYDFDDYLFIKKPLKVESILSLSDCVIAGNEFLKCHALRYNKKVYVLPTCIDSDTYRPRQVTNVSSKVVIGWIGTPSTSVYLSLLKDVCRVITTKFPFVEFRTVGGVLHSDSLNSISKVWSLDSEVNDLQSFDIGIMPLYDDEWAKGKCSFKIIQYMAVGIPSVASAVGMNKEVIEDGKDGFLVNSSQGWLEKLSLLIEDKELRIKMGKRAREKADQLYSVKANRERFLDIILNS